LTARVVGLGRRYGGDDAVGLVVLDRLRGVGLAPDVELCEAASGVELVELLSTPKRVVVVDAVVAEPPGEVRALVVDQLATGPEASLSSHGLGLVEALELARAVDPEGLTPDLRVVGITIAPPTGGSYQLSPSVAAAVEPAVEAVRAALS
jgi:hydrogenase maturation protease